MYQLRNLVKRRNVVSDRKGNEAACEDFMLTVTGAHILTSAMELFEMQTLTDTPSKQFFLMAQLHWILYSGEKFFSGRLSI